MFTIRILFPFTVGQIAWSCSSADLAERAESLICRTLLRGPAISAYRSSDSPSFSKRSLIFLSWSAVALMINELEFKSTSTLGPPFAASPPVPPKRLLI